MLPVLAFGVSLTLFAGVSWSALIAGVVLYFAMFALLGLLALPLPLSVLERPGTRATIPPLAGAVFELIRLEMVRLLDTDLEEALWLAFGREREGGEDRRPAHGRGQAGGAPPGTVSSAVTMNVHWVDNAPA
ncbi:hypothetical protein ACWDR9_08280 [Streptosporangium sandarakinum]|uniref:hypothetical protein n=1 Tax=Streptosporangium sandarakinum TaxID=1260955 RepID=UPI0036953D57